MKILGVIPARYASTRFEGKPLKDINGNTMIEWVYKRAENADIDKLVVATDDERIFNTVKKFGGNAVMTSKEHENGTSRIIEVINTPEYNDFDFIINIQGDEPLIDIKSINLLADNYRKEKSEIVTLKKEFNKNENIENPNIVKVITDFNDNAIYFSRSVIPYERNSMKNFKYYKHIGIYGYTSKFLNELKNLKEGILEKIESLEQLRFIENGYKIKVLETVSEVIGVDTEEDLKEVIKYIKENGIIL
jgi:3-deoxy-D-manno-octulosonate cytidylyltransferase